MLPTAEEQAFLNRQIHLRESVEMGKLREQRSTQHDPDAEEQAFLDVEIRKQEVKQWAALETQLEAIEQQAP